jgi:hypothetical protein
VTGKDGDVAAIPNLSFAPGRALMLASNVVKRPPSSRRP